MTPLKNTVFYSPLESGGFVWSYAFVCSRLAEEKIPRLAQNLLVIPLLERGSRGGLPDTRDIPEHDAITLWRAVGSGDCAAVDSIFNRYWEVLVGAQ
jgi:hypothetical protein